VAYDLVENARRKLFTVVGRSPEEAGIPGTGAVDV
jgi:hypothetical protein